MTRKMTSRPPKSPRLEEFIENGKIVGEAAQEENLTSESESGSKRKKKPKFPWEDPNIRDDVLKVYNLRIPEPYLLKLKYIAEHTPESMQQFCLKTLLPAIDKKISEL